MSDATPTPPTQSDPRFLYAATALMLLIIALLGGLWLSTRLRAVRAESELLRLRGQQQDVTALFQQAIKERTIRVGIQADQLATRPAQLDGRGVTALRLPAGLAEMLGFKAGDVILVDAAPATASAPAGAAATSPAAAPRQ